MVQGLRLRSITINSLIRISRYFARFLVCCALWPLVVAHAVEPVRAAGKVDVLGAFSHITHAEGDAFGYTVELWKEGDQIFGLLLAYVGPPADPPTGILEDVKFDPKTRRLSFTARMTTGLLYSREYAGVPSHDRFSFKGVLTRKRLVGVLRQSDDLSPSFQPTSKRITLRWSAFSTELMVPPPQTYSAWRSWADEILKFRGPKW